MKTSLHFGAGDRESPSLETWHFKFIRRCLIQVTLSDAPVCSVAMSPSPSRRRAVLTLGNVFTLDLRTLIFFGENVTQVKWMSCFCTDNATNCHTVNFFCVDCIVFASFSIKLPRAWSSFLFLNLVYLQLNSTGRVDITLHPIRRSEIRDICGVLGIYGEESVTELNLYINGLYCTRCVEGGWKV